MAKTLPKTIADEMLEDLVETDAENERIAAIARDIRQRRLEEAAKQDILEAQLRMAARRQARKMKENSEW